ncbi:phosphonate transport system ATP-binding protein [Sphaerochaeta associata]|uniref:Phosphonate ABC transporter ATP-binding protein n=1 Tax=Sphaerochaeta associata TaxID=1129264 RepID=A0ABY4DB86_9SPIR|nr:phosphonate ABC transporter ATP-binding protein [Sphaerochaeta associata]UOM51533.1 phosphonate ABC transporter ATP-binding protein [Sphaerochaeta associata]SMP61918.1 phosphonate transport system ATP-binding protein [Sphaerochaeta associata]
MVEIKELVKRYPSGQEALKSVSLTLKENTVMALIGPSGAGKSTLIRCINRLVEPTSGSIMINGVNVCDLGKKELRLRRRKIGMIFQEYALVDRLTVMENVLSGQLGYVGFWPSTLRRFPQEVVTQAYTLLERVGLSDFVDNRADQLSGGQRQRVGIARALIQNPELLLVDEPTASLDPKTSRQVMRLIVELVQERNLQCIINIHDVVLAKQFAQRIVGLQDGRIVFEGQSADLDVNVLNTIYGEEDWNISKKKKEDEDDEADIFSMGE